MLGIEPDVAVVGAVPSVAVADVGLAVAKVVDEVCKACP